MPLRHPKLLAAMTRLSTFVLFTVAGLAGCADPITTPPIATQDAPRSTDFDSDGTKPAVTIFEDDQDLQAEVRSKENNKKNPFEDLSIGVGAGNDDHPVSYTHLTLPTICSV